MRICDRCYETNPAIVPGKVFGLGVLLCRKCMAEWLSDKTAIDLEIGIITAEQKATAYAASFIATPRTQK